MGDWFRSVTVLAVAFVGAVVVTIGLANVIVPGEAAEPQGAVGGDDGAATATPTLPPITGSRRQPRRYGRSRRDADGDARVK